MEERAMAAQVQQAEEQMGAAIDETAEALFGVKRKGGVDAAEERQAAIERTQLKALDEKRQAWDGGAPLKEGWQVKDFRLMYDRDRQR